MSHNVQNLIHLCDDAEQHGTLNEFSAFPFESAMKLLVSLIRKAERSLQQVSKRVAEKSQILIRHRQKEGIALSKEQNSRSVINGFGSPKYSWIQYENNKISISLGDS